MWQGSGAIRRMLKEVALRNAGKHSWAVHFSNAGNERAEFHHPWCNSKRSQKSYVNRGLQRSKFVLLSDPFQKFPVKFLCSASRILLSSLGI
jgi:hypothetical protein